MLRRGLVDETTVLVGAVLIVVGVLFGWVICLGWLVIIAGIIVLVAGLMRPDQHRPIPPQLRYPAYPYGPPGARRFCQYCGNPVPPDSTICPSCGRRLQFSP